jgi:hypothetical protein
MTKVLLPQACVTVDNFSYHVKQLVLFLPQTYIWRSNISNLSVLMKVIPETRMYITLDIYLLIHKKRLKKPKG